MNLNTSIIASQLLGVWRGVYLCLIFEMSIWEFTTNSKKKSSSKQTRFFVEFELDFYCLCSLQKSISKSNWFFNFLNSIFRNWKKIEWHSIFQKSSVDIWALISLFWAIKSWMNKSQFRSSKVILKICLITFYQLCSFDTGSSFGRKWNIKVSQIPCDSLSAPPSSDCLQYFTALQDTVKSFNFDVTTTTVTTN